MISQVTHVEHANGLRAAILLTFSGLKPDDIKVDELAGVSMVDVHFPAYAESREWLNIIVSVDNFGHPAYGLSVIDSNETGFESHADCMFAHVPTMLKYVVRLFPLQAEGPADEEVEKFRAFMADHACYKDKYPYDYALTKVRQAELLANIKVRLPELEGLLKKAEDDYEDRLYRFYHQSFKVYHLQRTTLAITEILQSLLPDGSFNAWFTTIVQEGTGKEFEREDNHHWLSVTRPIVEAFTHAYYMLTMACKYGRELEAAPVVLPSGWAGLLYLYRIR